MGLFRYEAIDKSGKVVRGVMKAQDEQQVAQNLAAMGYSVRGIYATGSGSGSSAASAPAKSAGPTASAPQASGVRGVTPASGVPVSVQSKVPANQLAAFFRQLATLVRSGVSVQQSLFDLEISVRNRHLRDALRQMQAALQAGQSLSTAMAAHPDVFPAHTIGFVWCAEMSGKLDVLLGEIADDMEREASDVRRGRIGWGVAKASLIFFILTFPIYTFPGKLTQRMLGDYPAETAIASDPLRSAAGDVFRAIISNSVPLAVAVILIWVAWGHMKRVPVLRRLLDAALLRVPMWGKLHRYHNVGRFLHLLDELYAAGINPSKAWDAASVACPNSDIAEKLRMARSKAPASISISDLAALSKVLEPEEVAHIATGEKAGRVPETLLRLSETYAERAKLQKSAARVLSISLMSASLIALAGAALIVMAKTYAGPIARFLGMQ